MQMIVRLPLIAGCVRCNLVIKLVSKKRQVGGFSGTPVTRTVNQLPRYNNIVECGLKHP